MNHEPISNFRCILCMKPATCSFPSTRDVAFSFLNGLYCPRGLGDIHGDSTGSRQWQNLLVDAGERRWELCAPCHSDIGRYQPRHWWHFFRRDFTLPDEFLVNPMTGSKILNLDFASTRQEALSATIDSTGELVAREIVQLLHGYRLLGENEDKSRADGIRKLGEQLDSKGGFSRMRQVHNRVVKLWGHGSRLESLWHGVGRWLG